MNWRRKIHRIEGLVSPAIRKRLTRYKSVESVEGQLVRKCKEVESLPKIDLYYLIIHVNLESWRTRILELFLKRSDLTIDDLYEVMSLVGEDLLKKAWLKFLEIGADPNNLVYLIRHGANNVSALAFAKIIERIENGVIGEDYGTRILIDIITKIPEKRDLAWKKLKKMSPDKETLLIIADLPYSVEMDQIIGEAQRMIKSKDKRSARKPKILKATTREIVALVKRLEEIQEQE